MRVLRALFPPQPRTSGQRSDGYCYRFPCHLRNVSEVIDVTMLGLSYVIVLSCKLVGNELLVPAAVRFGRVPKREKARILAAMQQSCSSRSHEKALAHELEDEAALLSRVVRAHVDTCDFTREKVAPMLQGARQQPVYTSCPATLVSRRPRSHCQIITST